MSVKLSYVDLISSRLTEHARRVKSSDSEIITYYLNNTNGISTIDLYQGESIQRNYYTINNISHKLESKTFIRSIFER